MINFKNIRFEDCGTGMKVEGKVDLLVDGITCIGNQQDIDLSITDDSIVKIQNMLAIGTKLESISIKEYNGKIEYLIDMVHKIRELSESEKKFITENLALLNNNETGIIQKVLQNMKDNIKSIPGKVVVSLIAGEIIKLLTLKP